VTCSSGCDLRGEPVKVMTPDGVVITREQLASDAAKEQRNGGVRPPIRHAHVRLGFYITETDEGGLATFELPEGTHHLKIWKDGYAGPPMSVEVAEDVTIQVEALKTLTEAEIDEKVRQLEASSWG
jgi:hypothetical protein